MMVTLIGRCFGSISDCLYGGSEWRNPVSLPNTTSLMPEVMLDTSSMGQEAVVVKNGSRLCGTGSARATTPILQNKAYWEVKVQQSGIWSCGVATPGCDMNTVLGMDTQSWVLCSDGSVKSNQQVHFQLAASIQEGDIIGLSYDHVELNFYLNGVNLHAPLLGIKGTVYPVFYVDDSAILDIIFDNFRCATPPPGFDRIMLEKALL